MTVTVTATFGFLYHDDYPDSSGIVQVLGIQGTKNVCANFYGNPSNSCRDVSVWTEVVDRPSRGRRHLRVLGFLIFSVNLETNSLNQRSNVVPLLTRNNDIALYVWRVHILLYTHIQSILLLLIIDGYYFVATASPAYILSLLSPILPSLGTNLSLSFSLYPSFNLRTVTVGNKAWNMKALPLGFHGNRSRGIP